jgi:hypothetical protein
LLSNMEVGWMESKVIPGAVAPHQTVTPSIRDAQYACLEAQLGRAAQLGLRHERWTSAYRGGHLLAYHSGDTARHIAGLHHARDCGSSIGVIGWTATTLRPSWADVQYLRAFAGLPLTHRGPSASMTCVSETRREGSDAGARAVAGRSRVEGEVRRTTTWEVRGIRRTGCLLTIGRRGPTPQP